MEKEITIRPDRHRLMVFSLGREIMHTKEYQQGLSQIHHLGTTVSKHSFRVALLSLKLADSLSAIGLKTDPQILVRAALVHDLGILGRFEGKFSGVKKCCLLQHPKDSITLAKELIPDLQNKEINTIASHMWPLSASMPKCKEAWIVNLSDKIIGIRECSESWIHSLSHKFIRIRKFVFG